MRANVPLVFMRVHIFLQEHKRENRMYTLDKSRKSITTNTLKSIIPFQILEHAPHEKALIIKCKGGIFMSIKKNKKIILYPMKVKEE